MIIHIDQSEYIADVSDTAGIRVLVDNPGAMPFPEDLGLSVSPGFETSIGIRLVSRVKESSVYCITSQTYKTYPSCNLVTKQWHPWFEMWAPIALHVQY